MASLGADLIQYKICEKKAFGTLFENEGYTNWKLEEWYDHLLPHLNSLVAADVIKDPHLSVTICCCPDGGAVFGSEETDAVYHFQHDLGYLSSHLAPVARRQSSWLVMPSGTSRARGGGDDAMAASASAPAWAYVEGEGGRLLLLLAMLAILERMLRGDDELSIVRE
ncbi:hypothetical protein ColLi_12219 [Colletotrichum liriopes]|uniref:Uncharacterized protein n=1 Tax=Colletotrichum liriopes TaxID=708192 RepID=A0AA37LZA3_9PEZI|nr:hypothetical protein ColLi_12219 [Colletotrichum liriopes]